MSSCTVEKFDGIAVITLNDPRKRNALSLGMFESIASAIASMASDGAVRVAVLHGAGPVFCSGFDLAAANEDPTLMETLILRLSAVNAAIRHLPIPVIGSVRGAAIAGGCAMLSACDFVMAEPSTTFGYPVHAIGVSPAVTLPTLAAAVGCGPARALVLSGELIDGCTAHARGLITHLTSDRRGPNDASDDELHLQTMQLARDLAAKPPNAMRVTKMWLNELDGTSDPNRFAQFAAASAAIAGSEEARSMLHHVWSQRQARK